MLAEQCRLLQSGSVAGFIVLNPELRPELCPDLSEIPLRIVDKPNERGEWELGLEGAIAAERFKATVCRDELVAQAVAFGREQGVTAVWAMLEGQTIVRMALPLAEALGVPLYTQVWDPLSWWLREHHVDDETSLAVLAQFDATLRGSRACATASWNMAAHYQELYGTRCVPIISGYEPTAARMPPLALRRCDEIVVGMAGQFYANDAWDVLVSGLEAENWLVGGRTVRILYLGGSPGNLPQQHCTHWGYLPPEAAIDTLALHADILYCPYPFREEMTEVARLSFPSKIVMYAAAGRPILCHAPYDSSPAQYLDRTGAGAVCATLDARAVYDMLRWIASDPSVFARLAGAAQEAFRTDFTRAVMARNVSDFFS
ncbi:hypothetical protein GOFOIKOB_6351 [Methylobacterium tardum]|uniref:hypothetical protein n=1 Tax=Methylobacterium tardum TaxID=374432 RepID=UPI001EDE0896|nr:hypothetical protein [Methylobacterium tardum]URD37945.1 hypothetical protein M6G65_05445 [Methylobacterium tardum]GJE53273.1 hypothetical protein GOFOIKOB_6351 [Methylobacterium tardum]